MGSDLLSDKIKILRFSNYQKKILEPQSFYEEYDNIQVEKKDLKFSIFNYYFAEKKKFVIFNSMTATLLQLPIKYKSFYKTNLLDSNDAYLINILYKYGFLIRKEGNELQKLRVEMLQERFKTDVLTMVIIPTTACNFGCPYCYEGNIASYKMSDSVQDEIYALVKGISKKIAAFQIMWFGGEPLLALDVIEKLSGKLFVFSEKAKLNYSAGIITNGYLLTRSVAEKLKKFCVNSIQITLDGPREIHDKRRFLLNGRGSYDQILSNICSIIDIYPRITIRVNLDRENIDYIENLLNDLKERGLEKHVSIYFASIHVSCANEKIYDRSRALTIEEYFEGREALFSKMKFFLLTQPNYRLFPKLNAKNCSATKSNNFIIGPEGEFYKCFLDIGNQKAVIGDIFNLKKEMIFGIGNKNQNLCYQYMDFDPTQNSICKTCVFLPLCMGRCPKKILEKNSICLTKKMFFKIIKNESQKL